MKWLTVDELQKMIGLKLKFWRKMELRDIYYPLDEIMFIINEHYVSKKQVEDAIRPMIISSNNTYPVFHSSEEYLEHMFKISQLNRKEIRKALGLDDE